MTFEIKPINIPNKKYNLNTNTNGEHRAFVVSGSFEEVFPLNIYPLQILKPIASQLCSRVQSDKLDDDQTWREQMEKAVLDIPLKIKAKLSEPKLSMKTLINLKQGDVFPIQIGEGVEILMDEELLFKGEIGEVSGQAAINLTYRIDKI